MGSFLSVIALMVTNMVVVLVCFACILPWCTRKWAERQENQLLRRTEGILNELQLDDPGGIGQVGITIERDRPIVQSGEALEVPQAIAIETQDEDLQVARVVT